MENNFTRQLFGGNIVRAFSQCVAQHLLLLLNYNLVTHFSVFSPLKVIEEVYNNISSLKLVFALSEVVLVVLIFTLINYPTFVQSQKFDSRFQHYLSYFSASKAVTLLQYGICGVLLGFAYASFGHEDHESLFINCSTSMPSKFCINGQKLFFVLLGGWASILLFFRDNALKSKIIVFPIIHELTVFKIKKNLMQTLLLNFKTACLTSVSFMFMYYFTQKHLIHFLQTYLFLSIEAANLNGFFKIGQLLALVIYCTFVISSHELSKLIFNIFFTRHIKFPVAKSDSICLKEALQMSKVPFLQHLAFNDLVILSERDKDRRSVLFSLSLPGGHPHQWRGVFTPVINTVESFSDELNKLLSDVASPSKKMESKKEVKLLPTGLQIPVVSPVKRNFELSRTFSSPKSPNMRDLSVIYTNTEPLTAPIPAKSTTSKVSIFDACKKAFSEFLIHLKTQIQDPAILNYFLVSNAEYRLICILQNVQLVSWSIDSLSLLACASFAEDKYGIVQQDLSRIIVAMLKVKSVIEKLPKNSALHKVFLSYDKYARSNLKATVKRSLYRLSLTFGEYIFTLSLPPDAEQQMSHFLNFVES
nr:PREDICTED: nucleoporin NDC1 [Bemisia tabaci]